MFDLSLLGNIIVWLLLGNILARLFDLLEYLFWLVLVPYINRLYMKRSRFVGISNVSNVINTCAICLETDKEVSVKVRCGHIFHEKCISVWSRINPVCPLCRYKI